MSSEKLIYSDVHDLVCEAHIQETTATDEVTTQHIVLIKKRHTIISNPEINKGTIHEEPKIYPKSETDMREGRGGRWPENIIIELSCIVVFFTGVLET